MTRSPDLKIRTATINDAKSIAMVQISSWRAGYKGIIPDKYLNEMHFENHIRGWEEKMQSGDASQRFYVAETKGNITGFIVVCAPRDENAGFDYELSALYLHPEWWGQGVGQALFNRAVTDLKKHGIKNMYVWVLRDNTIARRFYSKMGGYEIKGLEKCFMVDGENIPEIAYGWLQL